MGKIRENWGGGSPKKALGELWGGGPERGGLTPEW